MAARKTASKPDDDGSRLRRGDFSPGKMHQVELSVSRLPGGNWLSLPVAVLRGTKPGKSIWLSGAIHGDELNGIEIIRRLLAFIDPKSLNGTVIAVPMVNVFGVLQGSRYLPDRRDLNRSFPGSMRGSLAARLAHIFMDTIVSQCDLGIDFHTGSNDRVNLPQVRFNAGDRKAGRLSRLFGAPVVYPSKERKGSLRWACDRLKTPVLLYEGGEANRFDDDVISAGVEGTKRVMRDIGMLHPGPRETGAKPVVCTESKWLRAKRGGLCRIATKLGARVKTGDTVAEVSDAFNTKTSIIRAAASGIIIGLSRNPLVNAGDALVHVGLSRP